MLRRIVPEATGLRKHGTERRREAASVCRFSNEHRGIAADPLGATGVSSVSLRHLTPGRLAVQLVRWVRTRAAGLLFLSYRVQALAVERKQMRGILLGLGGSAARLLESDPTHRGVGLAIAGRQGDELHQVERDVFVAARPCRRRCEI